MTRKLILTVAAAALINLTAAGQTRLQLETQATVNATGTIVLVWVDGVGIRPAKLGAGLTITEAAGVFTISAQSSVPPMWMQEMLAAQTSTDYALSQTPIPGSLHVFRNGLLQTEGVDYIRASNTQVSFLSPLDPGSDTVRASYQTAAPD